MDALNVENERHLLFDPIGDYNTEDIQRKLDSNELTPRSVLGGFRCPNRGNGVQDTSPDTIQSTS